MEMEVNMNMQLVFSICSDSTTIIGCAHSCAEKSLIPDGATPERCAGITHDKKCITFPIIKPLHKTCVDYI